MFVAGRSESTYKKDLGLIVSPLTPPKYSMAFMVRTPWCSVPQGYDLHPRRMPRSAGRPTGPLLEVINWVAVKELKRSYQNMGIW